MAVHLARGPVDVSAGRTRRLDPGRGSTRVAFTALAYAGYVAVMAALLVHLTPGTVEIDGRGSDLAEAVDRSGLPGQASGQATVLTITVDGPADSVDVLCATTTDRAPFTGLHVSPELVMDAFQRWCSPSQPVTGV